MKRLITTICLCVLFATSTALADWDIGDPNKWVQLPDLSPAGMDVLATHPKVLADDFLCSETGLITDIHIWGSWLNDLLPKNPQGLPDPTQVGFRLSIHSDIPAGLPGEYSRPGQLQWGVYFDPGDFVVRQYANDLPEGWYNPNTGEYILQADSIVWQYNFFIDPLAAFEQKGSAANPVVYWLDVEAFPISEPGTPEPLFGWKTSLGHWNDDAVWGDSPSGPWNELRYPSGHQYEEQSIDFAFAITPEPATIALLGLGALSLIRRKSNNSEKTYVI
jgi:hypothetical protein